MIKTQETQYPTPFFAGPQTESVVTQEATIAADAQSDGESKVVLRGTVLDGDFAPVATGDEASARYIAADTVSTDGAAVRTVVYAKGGFNYDAMVFGSATVDDAVIKETLRGFGINFHPVNKDGA